MGCAAPGEREYQDKYVYCLEKSYFYYTLSITDLALSDPEPNVEN
jgi:hypothetical protein